MRFKPAWLGAISMLAMSAVKALDFSKKRLDERMFRPPAPKRHKKTKEYRGLSKQRYDPARLILDRPSTVRKLQRWHRAGVIGLPEPDHRAKIRHKWYRDQKAREAQTL